jgi:hypothetical protein
MGVPFLSCCSSVTEKIKCHSEEAGFQRHVVPYWPESLALRETERVHLHIAWSIINYGRVSYRLRRRRCRCLEPFQGQSCKITCH